MPESHTQSKARAEARKTMPATPLQKEFFRFFNLKIPSGLTYDTASRYISEFVVNIFRQDREYMKKVNEWETYESIYEEINNPDFRKDHQIKKISLSQYRLAVEQLRQEGKSLAKLKDDDEIEKYIDILIHKLIEMKPNIREA